MAGILSWGRRSRSLAGPPTGLAPFHSPSLVPSNKRASGAHPDPGDRRGRPAGGGRLHGLCQTCMLTQLFLLEPWGC